MNVKQILDFAKSNASALFGKMELDLGISSFEDVKELWFDYIYLDYLIPEDLTDDVIHLKNFVFRPYDERTTRFFAVAELSKENDLFSDETFYNDFEKWLEALQ